MKLNFLSLLNAALTTDLIVVSLALMGILNGNALTIWYQKFGLGAFMADVLSLMIGFIIAFFIYNYFVKKENQSLLLFLFIVVCVQFVHDLLFGLIVSNYKGKSPFLNVFKLYIKEVSYKILLFDAAMVICTVLFQKGYSIMNQQNNIILLIVLSYLTPYLVFSI
jgi:hypothetical protein